MFVEGGHSPQQLELQRTSHERTWYRPKEPWAIRLRASFPDTHAVIGSRPGIPFRIQPL